MVARHTAQDGAWGGIALLSASPEYPKTYRLDRLTLKAMLVVLAVACSSGCFTAGARFLGREWEPDEVQWQFGVQVPAYWIEKPVVPEICFQRSGFFSRTVKLAG
jgi:hypothetical protein